MGNPSFSTGMHPKESSSQSRKDPNSSRGSRRQQQSLQQQGGLGGSSISRRPSASNLHQFVQTGASINSSSSSSSNSSEILHSQVAKLRIEEKYLSEDVETEGMERLALSHLMSSVKDFSVVHHESEMRPSPLGLRCDAVSG